MYRLPFVLSVVIVAAFGIGAAQEVQNVVVISGASLHDGYIGPPRLGIRFPQGGSIGGCG